MASTEKATPIWPLVAPAISSSRVESRRRIVGPVVSSDLSLLEPPISRRSVCAASWSRAAREASGSLAPPPAVSIRTSTTPKARWMIPCTVSTDCTCSSGIVRSFFWKTPRRSHDDEAEQEERHRPQAEPLAHQEDYAREDEPADPTPERPYGPEEHGDGVETLLRVHPAPWSARRCGPSLFRRQGSTARGSGLVRPRCKILRSRARTGAAVVPAWCPRAGCGPAARACG